MSKTELYLSRIIKYGLYAILLTPLAFWPKALYPFGTPKFILFQVLVEIVFAVWLILKLLKSDFGVLLSPFGRSPEGRKSDFNNWLVIALASFIAVSFISALFGVDFSRSFWGIGARMTGLFAEIHFFAWFLVLISISKSGFSRSPTSRDFDITRYLNFSFFVALAVAATAFYQNVEAGPILIYQWGLAYGSTVFNNPTFAAPYLIFHFFWGLYQTIKPKFSFRSPTSRSPEVGLQMPESNFKRWIFGIGSALIFFAVLLGQVRGAILGLFAGILSLGIFLLFSNITSRRFKIVLTTAFILIFIGFFNLWVFRDSRFIQNQSITMLKRLTQFSLSEATAQTRFLTWNIALKGFKDAPVLGAGPENFNYLFNANYDPKLLKFGGGGFDETWFDKPHNAFLEVLAETGIIGSSAYLLVWLAVVLAIFKLFKSGLPAGRHGWKILTFILTSAFVAYLGSVFFAFDSFGSWFGLYLFLAFLAGSDTNTRIHTNDTNIYSYIRGLFVIGAAIFVVFLLYINYSILRASVADADALRTFSRDPGQGLILFEKSLSYFTPYLSEYQFDLIASVAGAVEKGMPLPDLENTINFALGEADRAFLAHTEDAAKYTDMARVYNIFGTRGRDSEILDRAETFGNKSLELSPQRQETLYYLARTALLKGDPGLAVELTKSAVLAEPSVNLSHWYFGLALIADNQKQKGIAEIKKALELGYYLKNETEKKFVNSLLEDR